ncbi:hypothetical protein [Roseivivax sp. CAU 1761]
MNMLSATASGRPHNEAEAWCASLRRRAQRTSDRGDRVSGRLLRLDPGLALVLGAGWPPRRDRRRTFRHVQSLLRRPEDWLDNYFATVEIKENRFSFGHYERGRIVVPYPEVS